MIDDRAARRLLRSLADGLAAGRAPAGFAAGFEAESVAAWLRGHDLGAAGYALGRSTAPELARLLRAEALSVAAANAAHRQALARIEGCFLEHGTAIALLKGAAVAETAWGAWDARPMADLDLWVRGTDLERAARLLAARGFARGPEPARRPLALQLACGGEIQLLAAGRLHGLVELHGSAFPGLWLRRAASVDEDAVWQRTRPVATGRHARRLAPEDEVLQIASHLVIGQLGRGPLRGLLDLGLIARTGTVDWPVLCRRARSWGLATTLWVVLDLADALVGVPGAGSLLAELAPPAPRRAGLRALVRPARILAGNTLPARHAFLLLVVDRPRDLARLVGRTVWPERWWLAGRYGSRASRMRHLWHLARHGDA